MTVAGVRSWLFTIVREFGKIPEYNREGERLVRSLRKRSRLQPHDGRVSGIRRMPNHEKTARSIALSLWALVLISTVWPAVVEAGATVASDTVRVLAENVLGDAAVTSVRVSADGARVSMRWETVTYKPAHSLAHTRELIYTEAQLATGTVMGQLNDVGRVRFTILRKGQMLATGENQRGRGVTLMFSSQMGGGITRPTSPAPGPARPWGGEAAREL